MIIKNIKNKADVALVINWRFHTKDKWVSITAPYFVKAFIKEFDPLILSSQVEYELFKNKIKYIVSMEPGWAAPKLKYDKKQNHIIGVFVSDPHNKVDWFQKYIEDNDVTFVLSQYLSPFFYHFPEFPKKKFVHFPWAVPDELVPQGRPKVHHNDIMIFGGKDSGAYDVRNWCREQSGVTEFDNSGVENKSLSNEGYFEWLETFDASVAAGSSDQKYDLVTPKYFEIASVGSLLIGQQCKDLEALGFDETNMLIFHKENFNAKVARYLESSVDYLGMRNKGKSLILSRHLISHRVSLIKEIFEKKCRSN